MVRPVALEFGRRCSSHSIGKTIEHKEWHAHIFRRMTQDPPSAALPSFQATCSCEMMKTLMPGLPSARSGNLRSPNRRCGRSTAEAGALE